MVIITALDAARTRVLQVKSDSSDAADVFIFLPLCARTCRGAAHFQESCVFSHWCRCTAWDQAGIGLHQAGTGEGLDLSGRIDSRVSTFGAVPLTRPVPRALSLMGPALTTDPNCL